MKKIIFTKLILFFTITLFSQNNEGKKPINLDTTSIGFGYGLDYGGAGGSILFYPHRNIGLFVAVGYTPAGIGYNGGVKFRLAGKNHASKLVPFLTGMYGTNAGVAVENGEQYNKLFTGPSFGFGTDLKRKPDKHSLFTLAFIFPIYDSSIQDYIRDLRNNHGVQIKSSTLNEITFSVGFRFIIK